MEADVHILYESDFYRILDFRCLCQSCAKTKTEYTGSFSISFIKTGNFYYHTSNKILDTFNGEILISKPDYEYAVTHVKDAWDHCTVFHFSDNFYTTLKEKFSDNCSWFFQRDIQSILIHCKAEMQYLHDILLKSFQNKAVYKLKIDDLVFELVEMIFDSFSAKEELGLSINDLKKFHLNTIEKAKDYISKNFHSDISLKEIASHCYVSPFHFSRLFKSFTKYSPHQYLLLYRLKHSELLLKTTELPVSDICYLSGFNYIEHFIVAFKKRYKNSPSIHKRFLIAKE